MSFISAGSLISVIIPTCNRSELLIRAVTSVLAQTYQDIEIIVVVDGPENITVGRLQQLDDSRLKVIQTPKRVGGSEARNIGVNVAFGEWIAFLDDDDEWFHDKLTKQVSAVNRLSVRFPVIATRFIARTPYRDYTWPRRLLRPTEELSDYLFVRTSFFFGEGLLQTSTIFTSKELLQKIPFTSGLKKHQDWDWVLRVAQLSGVSFEILPEPLAIWYIEENRDSVSTNNSTWHFSFEWIKNNYILVTKRAYASFIVSQVGPQAARQSDWQAFWPLLGEMFRGGSPRTIDVMMYFAMWFIPQNIRRKIRAICTKVSC